MWTWRFSAALIRCFVKIKLADVVPLWAPGLMENVQYSIAVCECCTFQVNESNLASDSQCYLRSWSTESCTFPSIMFIVDLQSDTHISGDFKCYIDCLYSYLIKHRFYFCLFLFDFSSLMHSADVLFRVKTHRQQTRSLEYKPLIRKAGSPCHSLKTPLLMLHMRKTKAFICVHRRLWWWIIYPVAITDTGILLLLLFLFYSLSITAAHQQPCSLQLDTQTAEYISDVVWIWVGAGTCE